MTKTLSRLAIARELLQVRQRAAQAGREGQTDKKVIYSRQRAGLSAVLLGRVVAGMDSLDVFNPALSLPVLNDYMDSLANAEPHKKALAAMYLEQVLAMMSITGNTDAVISAKSKTADLYRQGEGTIGKEKLRRMVFEQYHKEGNEAYDTMEAVSGPYARLAELNSSFEHEDRLKSLNIEAETLWIQRRKIEKDILKTNGGYGNIEQIVKAEELRGIRIAVLEEFNKLNAEKTLLQDSLRVQKDAAKLEIAKIGHDYKWRLINASPVSKADAIAWAAKQTITPSALARMKKQGYAPAQVRADMAEFYRLTAGRLPAITIHSKGDKRANATDIESYKVGQVNMDGSFDKKTLFHELAHHLESDPSAKEASNGFLEKRRKSPATVPLRVLAKNSGYRPDENAYDDDFFNPYIGKKYSNGITEVISMGVESFADPEVLATRIAKDPEMFSFITGFLKTPPHPLYNAVKSINSQANDANAELQETSENELQDCINKLASKFTLIDDGMGWLEGYAYKHMVEYDMRNGRFGKYLGYIQKDGELTENWYVFESKKVQAFASNRKTKGYYIVHMDEKGGPHTIMRSPGTLNEMKARFAVYLQTNDWSWRIGNVLSQKYLINLKIMAGMIS